MYISGALYLEHVQVFYNNDYVLYVYKVDIPGKVEESDGGVHHVTHRELLTVYPEY